MSVVTFGNLWWHHFGDKFYWGIYIVLYFDFTLQIGNKSEEVVLNKIWIFLCTVASGETIPTSQFKD